MNDIIVAELVKKLPVEKIYEDAGQPAAKQTGIILEDAMKCIHLALAPFQLGAALQDRYRNFLDKAVRKVPEERRVSPPPQILGPILEGIKYEPEETELDIMASNLLATSMDKDTVGKAHPSYPNLLRQLSRDEIVILKELIKSRYYKIYEADLVEVDNEFGGKRGGFQNFRIIEDTFPMRKLHYPENLSFYINHLFYLGLAAMRKGDTQRLPEAPFLPQTGTREKEYYIVTDFGYAFAQACKLN